MTKLIIFGFTLFLISCISHPPYIDGKVTDNKYENDYFTMELPKDWEVRKPSDHIVLTIQKQINSNGDLAFPTVHLKAGTLSNNSFITYFENLEELTIGSFNRFKNNDIYITYDKIDSLENNDIVFYYFESKIDNSKFKIPDILQTHYFFKIDTMYFNLSVSDYDRFKYLKNDYYLMIKSIKKK